MKAHKEEMLAAAVLPKSKQMTPPSVVIAR